MLSDSRRRASGRQGTLGGVLVTLIAEGIALPAAVVTAMVLTRALGPETYGRFTVVASTIAVTEWLLVAVFARPVVKLVAEADDWKPVAATALRAYVGTGLMLAVAVWLLAGVAADALEDPVLATYFRLYALQIPLHGLGAGSRNVLAGRGRYREQAASSSTGWIGRVVFMSTLVWLGYGIEGAIVGSVTATFGAAVVAITILGWPGWRTSGVQARHLWQLALPAFLALLCARLLDQVGLLAVERLTPTEAEVGYYGAAMNVLVVTSVIAAAVTPVLISALTQARYRDDREEERAVGTGALRFGLVLFPFAAVAAGAAVDLVGLLFGPTFAPAAPILALLVFSAVARANVALAGAMLIARDRAWLAAWMTLPLPFLAVAAHVVVIPRYGGVGAALVTVSLALVSTLVSIGAVCRVLRVPPPAVTLLRCLVLGAAGAWGAAAWSTPGPLVLVKVAALAGALALGLVATGELSADERARLRARLFGAHLSSPKG